MSSPHASPKKLDGVGLAESNTKNSKACPLIGRRKRGLFFIDLLVNVFPFGRGDKVTIAGRDELFPEASAVVDSARVRAEELVTRETLVGILDPCRKTVPFIRGEDIDWMVVINVVAIVVI
jgi:hypothetical protein